MVEAERYLAEAVRLRGLGEQVAADVRERLRELDRCVADAERLVAEMWTARLRALHHFDQRPARERMTSDRCRAVSYTHLRAHETVLDLVCRLLLDKKKKT